MKIKTSSFFILAFFLSNCISDKCTNYEVLLDDLVVICANWEAKESLNIEEYAAVFQISGSDLMNREYYFSNDSFTVHFISEIKKTGEIKLKKSKRVKHINDVEMLKLFLSCDEIKIHFPDHQQKYGDSCYLQELTNMLATGKFYYRDGEDFIEIMKSPEFTFYIGAKPPKSKD